jgi:DNA repair protein RadA/Sms
MNVIGGLYLNEPASDAAIALALISSLTDKAVPDDLIAIGELGLSGECRAVSNLEQRVKEAARLGFTKAVIPAKNIEKRMPDTGIKLIPINSIYEAIKVLVASDNT